QDLRRGTGLGGGVVVAAEHRRHDLVVSEERGELATRPGGAGPGVRRCPGPVLAADACEELVDVVDHLHGAIASSPAAVNLPHPSGLSAATTTAAGTSIADVAPVSSRSKRSAPTAVSTAGSRIRSS